MSFGLVLGHRNEAECVFGSTVLVFFLRGYLRSFFLTGIAATWFRCASASRGSREGVAFFLGRRVLFLFGNDAAAADVGVERERERD